MDDETIKLLFLQLLLLIILIAPGKLFAETLKVASWNIAWLESHAFNKRTENDYKELARYAKLLDADVIALQEIENSECAGKVVGDDYDYYITKRTWVQYVGIAVRNLKDWLFFYFFYLF